MPKALANNYSLSREPGLWFQNHGLFSNHFPKARLSQWKEWQDDGGLVLFRKQLLSLYESTKAILPLLNESQTEKEFVQPVLDLLDVLKKNKSVKAPCPIDTRDTIAVEFSAAMKVLTPLKSRIEATDKLIDQIVYKLYALTDDEIAIVEGKEQDKQ